MATKTQVNNFIAKIAPIAVAICNKKTKKVLPSVCIAQACCESAYGTSLKMINANAVFGIKVGKSKVHFGTAWKDKAYSTTTKECYDGKNYTNITDMFRAYDSIQDAVEDYYDMLGSCSRYAGCIGVTDPEKCITAIKNGGYATDPKYVSTITSIIKSNNLTQYDTCMTGGAVKAAEQLPTLRKGNRGPSVLKLQEALKERGYSIRADGIIGDKTLEAVKAFQADNGLVVDGVVGAKTWGKL